MGNNILPRSVLWMLLCCGVVHIGAQSSYEPTPSIAAPWLDAPCEDPLLGLDGIFPPLGEFYYVLDYAVNSGSPPPPLPPAYARHSAYTKQRGLWAAEEAKSGSSAASAPFELIVSLCNKTVKTPRKIPKCTLVDTFFVGVFEGSDCSNAFDLVDNYRRITWDYDGTGGPAFEVVFGSSKIPNTTFTVTIRCKYGASSSSPKVVSRTAYVVESQSLCPATPIPSGSNEGGSHQENGPQDSGLAIAVILIASIAIIGLSVAIFVLWRRRRLLPNPPDHARRTQHNRNISQDLETERLDASAG